MEDYLIRRRIRELSQKDYLDSQSNKLLLEQYRIDKLNNVRPEDSEARTLLIVGNERLVFFVLRRSFNIFNTESNFDEFCIGRMGLIKAIDNFDLDVGCGFSNYATKVIFNEVAIHYRKMKTLANRAEKNKVFFDDYIACDKEGKELHLEEALGEEDDFIENFLCQETLSDIIEHIQYLSDVERKSIIYSFGLFGNKPLTQKEVADKLNVAQPCVSRATKRGLQKLRQMCLSQEEQQAFERTNKKSK